MSVFHRLRRRRLRGADGAQVRAQAKINLRLRILAREASGFHQLETLFLRLTLADVVRVRRADAARSLDVTGEVDLGTLGSVERNLAWRAAVAYCDAAGWEGGRRGFAIELEKHIPIGGGLGGGSADAGAVLRALDAISPAPLGVPALLRIAASLGADVPFLTSEHPYALAWGRGERLLPLRPPPSRNVLLLLPGFGVSTVDAYGWLAESRTGDARPLQVDPPLELEALSRWNGIAAVAVNDFEPVVAGRHPVIAAALEGARKAGAGPAMLSGSGSTMFCVMRGGAVAGLMPARDVHSLLTSTAVRVERVVAFD